MATSRELLEILVRFRNEAGPGVKSLQANIEGLRGAVKGLAAAFAIREAFQLAKEMGTLAAEVERATKANVHFAGSAAASEERVRAVQTAAAGGVDRLQALQISARGAALGFGATTDSLGEFVRIAGQVSTNIGGDLVGNIENMAAAAANLSFVRLDTLGLSADETRKQFEKLRGELGDTAAFVEAMKIVADQTFGDTAVYVSGIESWERALRDLKIAASESGGVIDELFGAAADGADDMSTAVRFVNAWWKANTDSTSAVAAHKDVINDFAKGALKQWFLGAGDATEAADALKAAMAEMAGDAGVAAAGIDEMASSASLAARKMRILRGEIAADALTPAERQRMGSGDPMFDNPADRGSGSALGDIMAERRAAEEQSAQEFNRIWQSAYDQQVKDAERAFETLKGQVAGVLSGSLDIGVGVDPDDFLPRPDALNEDARRLADVMVNGFSSPWAEYFRDKFPQLFEGGDIQGSAAKILQDFQAGLVPELIDKEAAKERVRRMLLGDARMDELAREIAAELSTEMGGQFSAGQIQAAVGSSLGGGFTDGLEQQQIGAKTAAVLSSQMASQAENLKLSGATSGATWGGGFLAAVESNVPPALIHLLAVLVTPDVQSRIMAANSTTDTVD